MPPTRAAEAACPPRALGRHFLRRRSHFNTPDLGTAASLRASIPREPAAGSSSGLLQRLQRAGGLPIDCPSSPGRSPAADRAAGHALPARCRSCETLGRRRLHRVVPSNHATSGSRGPWQVEPRPHAEGAATGPHRARPRACRVYVFMDEDLPRTKEEIHTVHGDACHEQRANVQGERRDSLHSWRASSTCGTRPHRRRACRSLPQGFTAGA